MFPPPKLAAVCSLSPRRPETRVRARACSVCALPQSIMCSPGQGSFGLLVKLLQCFALQCLCEGPGGECWLCFSFLTPLVHDGKTAGPRGAAAADTVPWQEGTGSSCDSRSCLWAPVQRKAPVQFVIAASGLWEQRYFYYGE